MQFFVLCDVSEYLSNADSKLFLQLQSPCYYLLHTLPPEKTRSMWCGCRSPQPKSI